MGHPLDSAVRDTCRREGLIAQGARVMAAVSGGQDSAAMLHCLAHLREPIGFDLCAAHVHHGIRGRDADMDLELVKQLASDLSIECMSACADVPALARRTHRSVQEAARDERHRCLNALADAAGASHIALAHTSDDRVETILLNIIRGCGIRGLTALRPREGRIIRPLIEVTRDTTGDYCAKLGVATRQDSSNRDLHYRRNRLRSEVIPHLAAFINPEVRLAILRLSESARLDDDLLTSISDAAADERLSALQGGGLAVSRNALRSLHPALRARVLRAMIWRTTDSLMDTSHAAVTSALAYAVSDGVKRRSWTLPNGAVVTVADGDLTVDLHYAPVQVLPSAVVLSVPGLVTVGECQISAEPIMLDAVPPTLSDRMLDMPEEALKPPIVVRHVRSGDRIRPMGLGGTKKLGDCFTDKRIPRRERSRRIVVADANGILWSPGVVADERVRIAVTPCACVRLTYRPGL